MHAANGKLIGTQGHEVLYYIAQIGTLATACGEERRADSDKYILSFAGAKVPIWETKEKEATQVILTEKSSF